MASGDRAIYVRGPSDTVSRAVYPPAPWTAQNWTDILKPLFLKTGWFIITPPWSHPSVPTDATNTVYITVAGPSVATSTNADDSRVTANSKIYIRAGIEIDDNITFTWPDDSISVHNVKIYNFTENSTTHIWKLITNPNVLISGIWTNVKAGYVKIGGLWRQFYPGAGTAAMSTPGITKWTVPPGIHSITVNLTGGGGGGGGSTQIGAGDAGGGGGSSGTHDNVVLPVVPGEILTIKVGGAGAGAALVGDTSQAPDGSTGASSTITGSLGSFTASGGAGGKGGFGVVPAPLSGGSGCCVISSALAEKEIWSQRDKFDLIDWCEKHLHNTWWGETFRRGYQVIGSKIVVPYMKKTNSLWSKYITWAFTNGCNLVRGKKFSWYSAPSTFVWILGFMLVGAIVSKNYATKCWINLYKGKK